MFAAVYAVVSLLPGLPILGLSGSEIDFARSLEIGYGLILGPVLGPSSAFLGAVVGKLVSGDNTGLIFTPLAIVSSLMAATLSRSYIFRLKGWIIAALVMATLATAWYIIPAGRSVPFYIIPHLAGLVIILIFGNRIAKFLHSSDKKRLTLGVILASFPATMAGQLLGSIMFMLLFNPTPLFFMATLPVTIIERASLTILATLIGVPLILAARNASFMKIDEA